MPQSHRTWSAVNLAVVVHQALEPVRPVASIVLALGATVTTLPSGEATSLVTLLFKAFVPSLPELGGGK